MPVVVAVRSASSVPARWRSGAWWLVWLLGCSAAEPAASEMSASGSGVGGPDSATSSAAAAAGAPSAAVGGNAPDIGSCVGTDAHRAAGSGSQADSPGGAADPCASAPAGANTDACSSTGAGGACAAAGGAADSGAAACAGASMAQGACSSSGADACSSTGAGGACAAAGGAADSGAADCAGASMAQGACSSSGAAGTVAPPAAGSGGSGAQGSDSPGAAGSGAADPTGAAGSGGSAGSDAAVPELPLTVFIASDSTASNYKDTGSDNDQAGWGQMLPELVKEHATVDNRAIGGRTARRFIDEGRLDEIWAEIQPGDYLLVQFGTNDGNRNASYELRGMTIPYYLDPASDFKTYVRRYIAGAKERGAVPVLVTPPPRNSAYCTGGNGTNAHAQALRELGESDDVGVVDLNMKTVQYLQAICPEPNPPDFFLQRADGSVDGTHFQERGARKLASFVAEGLHELTVSWVKD